MFLKQLVLFYSGLLWVSISGSEAFHGLFYWVVGLLFWDMSFHFRSYSKELVDVCFSLCANSRRSAQRCASLVILFDWFWFLFSAFVFD